MHVSAIARVRASARATASASAQTIVNPQPPVTTMQTQNVAVVQEQATGNVLRAGAPVPVVLSEVLTTKGKRLKVGQRVQLEVAQDVLLNGRVVIPARSPVEGVLTEVRNKGMWGKSGGIHLQYQIREHQRHEHSPQRRHGLSR